jgi:hypothetical protein
MWDNLWIVSQKDCKINRLQDVVAVDNLSTRRWELKNRVREKYRKCRKYLTTEGLFYIIKKMFSLK